MAVGGFSQGLPRGRLCTCTVIYLWVNQNIGRWVLSIQALVFEWTACAGLTLTLRHAIDYHPRLLRKDGEYSVFYKVGV
jgi:hypothetical protein